MRLTRRWLAPAVLVLASAAGCISLNFENGSWGGGSEGSSSVTRNGTSSSDLVYLTRDNRKELLLLVEGSASGSVSGGPPARGTILGPNGRMVNWSCSTRFGKFHEIRIDDTAFPLAAGRVFHIDARGAEVLVRQLDLDPEELVSGTGSHRENLRAHAGLSPVIAGFCERTNPVP